MPHYSVTEIDYRRLPGFDDHHILTRLAGQEWQNRIPLFDRTDPGVSGSRFLNLQSIMERLADYNRSVGNGPGAALLDHADESVRFVIAGQQPGLLLGPLYSFWKAVSVIAASRLLARATGIRHIPAFWVASDDHDVLEVNHCRVLGQRFTWDYPDRIRNGHVPQVHDIPLLDCRDPLLAFLDEVLPATAFRPWLMERINGADFSTYSTCFASLMARLFTHDPLVIVDSVAIRSMTAPVLAELVDHWPAVCDAFETGSGLLKSQGIAPPLADVGLFELIPEDGRRVRVKCRVSADGITGSTGKKSFSDTADDIRNRPMDFSGGAALRPILQDAVLPVTVTFGGPAEMAYLWQIDPIYPVAGVHRSRIHPRISVTILDQRMRRIAEKLGLFPDRWTGLPAMIRDYHPDRDDLDIRELEQRSRSLLDCIIAIRQRIPEKWVDKAAESVAYQVQKLSMRIQTHRQEQAGIGRSQMNRLAAELFPDGRLQERVSGVFSYLIYYGPEFVERSIEKVKPLSVRHQMMTIGED